MRISSSRRPTLRNLALACSLIALAPGAVCADGAVDLTSGVCPSGGSHSALIDCASAGSDQIVGTIIMPATMSDLIEVDAQVTFDFGSGPVPEFWDFQTLNSTDLTLSTQKPSSGCAGYTSTFGNGFGDYIAATGPHSVSVLVRCSRQSPLSATAGQKLFAFSLIYDATPSIESGGTLSGCESPAVAYVDWVQVHGVGGGVLTCNGPSGVAGAGDYVVFNGASAPFDIAVTGVGSLVSVDAPPFAAPATLHLFHVAPGGTRTLNFAAESGYILTDVRVDGVSVGVVSNYTFTNVQANHTIAISSSVSFLDINAGLPAVSHSSVAWGDFDRDGNLDILLAGSDDANRMTRVYRNSGGANPTFSDIGAGLTGVSDGSLAWGDFDNDGNLDILLTGYTGSTFISKVYRNGGPPNWTFTDIGAGLPGVAYSSVAWGDYDNDGHPDILLTGAGGSGPLSKVYRNSGGASPTFTDVNANLPGVELSSAAWGDFDNDGRLDILLTGDGGLGTRISRIYRNAGGANPGFIDVGAALTPVNSSSVAWGDYDHDGDLDILLTGDTGTSIVSRIYRNSGAPNWTFTDIGAGLPGVANSSVAWGEFDNDGNLDFLLVGAYVSTIYRSSGGANPSFTAFSTPLAAVGFASAAWADYDNDGALDILLTGSGSGASPVSRIYRNTVGTPANSAPAVPSGATAHVAGTVVLSWSAPADDHTPAAGLTYNLRVGSSPGALDIRAPMANLASGQRQVAQFGSVQGTSWPLNLALTFHTNPRWSVQAVDGAFAGGPFTAEQQAVLSATIASAVDIPGDQGGWLRLTIDRSPLDDAGAVYPVSIYGVWRHIPGTTATRAVGVAAPLAARVAVGDGGSLDRLRSAVPAGLVAYDAGKHVCTSGQVLGVESTAAAFPPGVWELVASVPALQQSQYVVAVPTLSNAAPDAYVVTANTTTPSVWYASDSAAGQSQDNLAPVTPAPFVGVYASGETNLHWGRNSEADLSGYRVYRGSTASFVPDASNRIAAVPDTGFADTGPAGHYYKLSAVDVNGNESPFATLSPTGTTDVPEQRAVALTLEGARPNPTARGRLEVAFALPAAGDAHLTLVDTNGRVVAEREVGMLGPGRHSVDLAEGVSLAPSVYFVRLVQGAHVRSMRVTVLE